MYFPYFHSFITFFILAISRSNFAQIQWSWTFFNSQDNELFKNVQDFRIWVKFDRVMIKKTLWVFFCSPFTLLFSFEMVEFSDYVEVNTYQKNLSSQQKLNFANKVQDFLAPLIILNLTTFLHCFSFIDKGGNKYQKPLVGKVLIGKHLFVVMTMKMALSSTKIFLPFPII